MTRLLPLLATLALAGCQVYAGGGTVVSDGRSTTVRTNEVSAGTGQGVRARTTETVVRSSATTAGF
jgi:hypothetical protein